MITSLHVIGVLSSQIKNPGYAYILVVVFLNKTVGGLK